MATKTFSFNLDSRNTESLILTNNKVNTNTATVEVAKVMDSNNNLTPNLLAQALANQELYQLDINSVELAKTYDTSQLVVDTEIVHVDAPQTLLKRHLSLFNSIREKINSDSEDTALHARLKAFIQKWLDDPDIQKILGQYFNKDSANNVSITRDSSILKESAIKKVPVDDTDLERDNDSSALFKLSRFAMDDFHRMSTLRRDVIRLKRSKTLQLRNSLKVRSQLNNEIDDAREEFENIEKTVDKAEENYSLVRGLLEQQLQAVDDAFAERHRILSSPTGLCFVRISDLPIQISFHQTPLIAQPASGQLPSICQQATELPERLQPFLELLDDQPMSSWKQLQPYWRWLPKAWSQQPPPRVIPQIHQNISLMPLPFHSLMLSLPAIQNYSTAIKSGLSLAASSKLSADEVTLEQLTKSRHAGLRQRARRLQDDLTSALSCLLQQLQEIPAADRYNWSRLAENDALNTETPLSWPNFHVYSGQMAGLYLREIIEWLYLQLDKNAKTESRSALRTCIRACLLQAVNDDPQDLLHGKVIQFPGFIKPGVLMTASLNRIPALSDRLKVYDGSQQLIAEARVIDSHQTEANIEVISTYTATPAAFSSWTVVGHKAILNAGFD